MERYHGMKSFRKASTLLATRSILRWILPRKQGPNKFTLLALEATHSKTALESDLANNG